jgi:hypothetical protein
MCSRLAEFWNASGVSIGNNSHPFGSLAMLTPAECQKLASEYKSLAQQPNVSKEHAVMLTNIARTLSSLATQLDKLAAYTRDHAK